MVCASNNVVSNLVQGLESLLHCLQSFHKELQINDKVLLLKIGHVHVITLLSACNCGTCTADKVANWQMQLHVALYAILST